MENLGGSVLIKSRIYNDKNWAAGNVVPGHPVGL